MIVVLGDDDRLTLPFLLLLLVDRSHIVVVVVFDFDVVFVLVMMVCHWIASAWSDRRRILS